MNPRKKILLTFMVLLSACAYAQETPLKVISLDDLSFFKPQTGNWQIVGDVTMNPGIDIHQQVIKAPAGADKKNKKSKTVPVAEPLKAVTFVAGKGILLNINDEVKKDHIITTFEHGDIELELEVMLPKGSNSGIYLQGRYEVQLLDSWGVKNPKYSDIGGIYRNWETDPAKIYMGKAPLSNPAKAPGLWQTLKISFQAPRFDAAGKKIANARFEYVELNGVRIHDNVEVPLPTGGPVENNEKPTGPIMIQGDHGPVAIRNFRYRLMEESKVTASEITYKTYSGEFQDVSSLSTLKPVKTGTTPQLTAEIIDDENNYGVVYSGSITIPVDDTYQFVLATTGGTVMKLNGETIIDLQRGDVWRTHKVSRKLSAGTYPFEILNFKTASWMPPRLRLAVSTPSTYPKELQAFNSYPPSDNPTSPILIGVGNEPRLLRAFVDFKGDRNQRLTHSIGVGDPSGTHYVYDMETGNLACVWRGQFVDATPMWHDRGDGSFKPRGAAQFTFMNQPLAFLSSPIQAFPAMSKESEFRTKGYAIEESTGRPVFKYVYQGLEVEDKIYPDDQDRSITHEVVIKNRGTKTGLYYKLAEGSSIITLPDGSYAIDKQFYIKSGTPATVREVNGKKELVVVVESNVKYTIIW
ncbi:MAG TPA: family 16 glycoside hydrolase [Ohtaekwangia sp.]